ncbi:hypothetical protein VTK26DRAFT_3900 [Humicola hyalothermophila]
MPALLSPSLVRALALQPRQTVDFGGWHPPPFGVFDDGDDTDDDDYDNPLDDGATTSLLWGDRGGGKGMSPGTIAATVVSVLVFFMLVTGIIAYFVYRRRKASKDEIALKELETPSLTAVPAAGAGAGTGTGAGASTGAGTGAGKTLDPPPPYEEVGSGNTSVGNTTRDSGAGSQESHRSGDASDLELEEDGSSHPTITDGIRPAGNRS